MSRTAQQDFEDYVARVMAASGADANFDDCFRNINAAYAAVCAERDVAVRERDLLMLEPNNRLDGYREIGAKCAALEDRLDSMKAERDEWKKCAEELGAKCEGLSLAVQLAQGDRDRALVRAAGLNPKRMKSRGPR